MEKSQLDLCLNVLKKLNQAAVLAEILIVGSWCLYFYKFYFTKDPYVPDIRTRDIDLLVPARPRFKQTVDIPALLEDMGFIIGFRGNKGYIRLEHPELGKGHDKPYPLPQLGLNAQPLRFLEFLARHIITVKTNGLELKLPHPIAYALHKLIISGRRRTKDKSDKDRLQAVNLLHFIARRKENIVEIRALFDDMHKKWQKNILNGLEKSDEKELIAMLT